MAKEISVEMAMLFDLYAPLLSEKKKEAFSLYYFEDLSLAEIAEIQGVTRQAVLEGIKQAENKLTSCEQKLGFLQRLNTYNEKMFEIADLAKEIKEDKSIADKIISICNIETE